jgi:hypothetical protein
MATITKESGTLKSFVPLMQNNQHKTWRSTSGSEYWDFTVIMTKDDGSEDTGTMSSTKDTPNWKKETKCTYDRTVYEGEHGEFIKFSKFTPEKVEGSTGRSGGSGGGGGYKKMTKEDRDRIVRAVALEVAHNAIIDIGRTDIIKNFKTVAATANVFAKFVHQYSFGIREKEMMLENALRRGVDGIQMSHMKDPMIQGIDDKGVPLKHPDDFWKEELRGTEIEGIWSAKELTKYAACCFAYIWEETDNEGNIIPIDKLTK